MFTNIENITSTKPRQAEKTDTRQDIRHQNSIFDREQKENKASDDNDLSQNNGTLSVSTLKTFLEKFVQNKLGKTNSSDRRGETATPNKYPVQTDLDLFNEPPKLSGAAARAASAYESMARAKQKRQILLETTDQADGPPIDLNTEDIRRIYALIEDLKILIKAKIEYIRIERKPSFLESLESAVNAVKQAL